MCKLFVQFAMVTPATWPLCLSAHAHAIGGRYQPASVKAGMLGYGVYVYSSQRTCIGCRRG